MNDSRKTKAELIDELVDLRTKVNMATDQPSGSGQPGVPVRDHEPGSDADQELLFKSALLQAQDNFNGILVVDTGGKVVSANDRMRELWAIPKRIWNTKKDARLLEYAAKLLRHPDEFKEKVAYLYAHPEKKSQDEIELKDGRYFDRYSAPLTDFQGNHYGRIWFFRDITERKTVELALRESEARFKTIFEQAPDGMYLNDLKGVFLDGNRAAENLLGYSKEELVGKSFLKLGLLSPLQLPKAAKLLAMNVLGHPTGPDEFTLIQKGGGQLPVEIRTFPVTINSTPAVLGIARDITVRKEAERALRESEERLLTVMGQVQVGIGVTNKEGFLQFSNAAMTSLTGYATEEIIGRRPTDFLHPDDRAMARQRIRDLAQGAPEAPSEYRLIKKDGETVQIEIFSRRIVFNEEPAILSIISDITERKASDQRLRESEERYRDLYHSMPLAYFSADRYGILADMNERALELTGYSRDELVGMPAMELYADTEHGKAKAIAINERVSAGEQVNGAEMEMRRADGSTVWVSLSVQPELANQRRRAIVEDITVRKEAEKALQESLTNYQFLLNNSPDPVFVSRIADFRFTMVNQRACDNYGYTVEEFLEMEIFDIETYEPVREEVRALYDSTSIGQVLKVEGINKRKDGTTFPVDVRFTKINGDLALAIVRDISEQMEAEGALQAAHDLLEQRVAERTADLSETNTRLEQEVAERKQAEETIRQRTEDLTLINDLNNAVNHGDSLQDIIQLLSRETARMFSALGAAVYLLTDDDKYLTMQNLPLKPAVVKRVEKIIGIKLPRLKIPLKTASLHLETIQSQKPHLFNDPETIKRWAMEFVDDVNLPLKSLRLPVLKLVPQVLKIIGIRSTMVQPLVSHGKIIGLLDISKKKAFSEADLRRFGFIAGQMTTLINRKQAEEEINARNEELAHLHHLDELSLSGAGPHELAEAFSDRIVELFGGYGTEVYFLTPDGSEMVLQNIGLKKSARVKLEKLLGDTIKNARFFTAKVRAFQRVIESREPLFLNDDQEIKGHIKDLLHAWNKAKGWRGRVLVALLDKVTKILDAPTFLIIPLRSEDDVLGAVQIMTRGDLSTYDKGHILRTASHLSSLIMRARAEAALSEQAQILQQVHEAVIVSDLNKMITFWNKGAQELFGYDSNDALNLQINFLIVDDEKEVGMDGARQEALQQGQATIEWRMRKNSGETFVARITLTPYKSQGGKTLGIIRTITDITQQRKLEEEQLRSQKLESLGILAGGLAHDFNNLLTGITLNVGTARVASQDPEVVERLRQVDVSIGQARGITQQLLTFSRGGSPILQPGDIRPVIREGIAFALHGTKALAKLDIEKDLDWVVMDENQINQVINNLTINAAQSMPSGGRVTVRVRNIRVRKNDDRPLSPGRYVQVSIGDEGTGIVPEVMDFIFDPYFTTKNIGNGLGLTSCHSIIEKHGGWISAESEVGRGSTFTFYLPASVSRERRAAESPKAVGNSHGHILVMDDDDMVRRGFQAILELLGNTVVTTGDGDGAVTAYQEALEAGTPFHAVILDLTIPGGVGGEGVLKRLQELDSEVRAIVCSGYATDPVMANFREHGFRAVLVKPFKEQQLHEVLDEVLAPS
ncbi:MAG: PAS domain S-box protein [Candidatus Marinimicrobia bacterium]|nr:PAS domain S-box protein [Candidatus Neomarinimicrobiota bacterium]